MIERHWRRDALRVHLLSHIGLVVASAVVLVAGQPATAQYASDFEAPLYTGSADGTIITGQDEFYIPVPDSFDGLVYTYAGNALGLPANPTSGGNLQFAGVTGGDPNLPVPFARAQRDLVYGDGTGVWTVSFDIAATFNGVLPSAQNIGSFSTQVFPGEATFIALATWTDPDTAANWNADYVWFDAAGNQLTESVADPAFQGLDDDHWYRWSTTFNLDTNQILQVSITDLTTGVTSTNSPSGRYLDGGAGGGAPTPTGFRLFGGSGTVEGNSLGFDNVDIDLRPAPPLGACCLLDESCVVLTEADCTAADGIYSGDGTGCTPITCLDVPPACGAKDAGPCGLPNGTPGCEDVECCVLVCEDDPICCILEWDQLCADAAIALGCASGPILASADGLWTAELDNFGQIENFFPSTQPKIDNVFESLIYEANSQGNMLSRRVGSNANYTVVEGPTIAKDGTSAFTRLEANDADLAIEIEILMLDGLSGGALVKIRCENTGNAAVSCKIFYYCDYDISGDFGDDEAITIPDPPDPIFAIEQIDNVGGKGPKPLWFGGCPDYEGWEIEVWPVLRDALDGGVKGLANADATPPGSLDHTTALSSATTLLQPGEIVEFQAGIGGVDFEGCPSACPWDLNGDGTVGAFDLVTLLNAWGPNPGHPADFNGDGLVGALDLVALLFNWGPCP